MNLAGTQAERCLRHPVLARLHRSALPLSLLATCLLFACAEPYEKGGRLCGGVGCSSFLEILMPADAPPGEWTIEVDADGMAWICTATLPLAAPADAGCSGADVWPTVDEAGTYHGVALQWWPETVAIRLFHEGELVDEVSQASAYDDYYPNGKECDLFPCRIGSVQLHLRGAR